MRLVFLFIFLSYCLFFFLIQPAQTPDEMGHFETAYWVSQFTYPAVNQQFEINPSPYGAGIAALFNFGNEDPRLLLNFRSVATSELQNTSSYALNNVQQFHPMSEQAYNPPLYYTVAAVFLSVARKIRMSMITQFYLTRFASTCFYFGTVFIFSKLLHHWYPPSVVKHILLVFSLNPLLLQSGIGISPDIAVMFFATMVWWFIVRKLRQQTVLQTQSLLALGMLCGLAMLSKVSGVFLVPTIIGFLWLQTKQRGKWIRACLLFLFMVGITQLPWIAHNLIRYQKITVESVALGLPESTTYSISLIRAMILTAMDFRHTFMHYAGFLGWNDAFPFPPVFMMYTVVFVMSVGIGIVLSLRKQSSMYTYMLLSVASLFTFFFLFGLQRKLYFHPGWGIGGRNILPIFPQLLLFALLGVSKKLDRLAPVLSGFTICYSYFILVFVLLPRYYV